MSDKLPLMEIPKEGPDRELLSKAVDVLINGGVIVAPTETVYGLMTLWDNPAGRERIYNLKQRQETKPLQMLAYDFDTILKAGIVETPKLRAIAESFWPGPLTVVCRHTDGGTVGARIPAGSFARLLLRELGHPVAASSANLSGHPTPSTAREAAENLQGIPDLVLEGEVPLTGAPSTVLSLLEYDPEILREGPILRGHIIDALRKYGLRR